LTNSANLFESNYNEWDGSGHAFEKHKTTESQNGSAI